MNDSRVSRVRQPEALAVSIFFFVSFFFRCMEHWWIHVMRDPRHSDERVWGFNFFV